MDQRTESGTVDVAKVQKSLLIPPELAELIDAYQGQTGANFTRVVTAALLEYFFGGYMDDKESPSHRDDRPNWIPYAVALERGEITLADMPEAIIQSKIEQSEFWLRGVERGDFTATDEATLKDRIKRARRMLEVFENVVDRFDDNKLQAIIDLQK